MRSTRADKEIVVGEAVWEERKSESQTRGPGDGGIAAPALRWGRRMRQDFRRMSFDQGQFNFDAPGSDAGWRRWREELDEKKRAFESRWGVVLCRRVTVCLRDHAKPLSGMLEWQEPPKVGRNAPPRFKLRGLEFGVGEIESIVQDEREVS